VRTKGRHSLIFSRWQGEAAIGRCRDHAYAMGRKEGSVTRKKALAELPPSTGTGPRP